MKQQRCCIHGKEPKHFSIKHLHRALVHVALLSAVLTKKLLLCDRVSESLTVSSECHCATPALHKTQLIRSRKKVSEARESLDSFSFQKHTCMQNYFMDFAMYDCFILEIGD